MKVQRIYLTEAEPLNQPDDTPAYAHKEDEQKLPYTELVMKHKDILNLWMKKGLPIKDSEEYYRTLENIARSLSKDVKELEWNDLKDYANNQTTNGTIKPGTLEDKVKGLIININKASEEEIIDVIKQAATSTRIAGLPKSIGDNLANASLNNLRSFVISADDELLNRSSRLWPALGNPSAKELLSSTSTFPLFYNLLIDKSIKLDADYLNKPNSVIYNKNLYTKVKDQGDRLDLVELDLYKKVPRADLNDSVDSGTYPKYISSSSTDKKETTSRATRISAEVKKLLDNMSEPERINFISLMFDVDNAKATELYNKIK